MKANFTQLNKAARLALELDDAIRAAHSEAIDNDMQAGQELLFDLIEPISTIKHRLNRVHDALYSDARQRKARK